MPHVANQVFERSPIGHRAVGLVGLAGLADGGVKLGPFLRLVLGFEEVAQVAEAVGVALTAPVSHLFGGQAKADSAGFRSDWDRGFRPGIRRLISRGLRMMVSSFSGPSSQSTHSATSNIVRLKKQPTGSGL